ncbi:MAG: translation initiation factor IF-2, partial [Halobacteriaceae archaeon]
MSDVNTQTTSEDLRTPIVAVLGHVDHGKTSLLDKIRGSAVIEAEAGEITQHIGATAVPLDIVSGIAGELINPDEFDLPGLLFIDTPGHHSFTTLRSRGGALADIAILVIDINDGFQPQTREALNILENTETPFVVAANKIDTIAGWNPHEEKPIQASYSEQSDRAQSLLDDKLYDIIGELSDAGFSSDLYWRVQNFRQNIGVIPVSAKTGEGVPDLLTVLMGLAQRYMKEEMEIDVTGPGVGTVLEVKEEQGFGTTIDVILYDGVIKESDTIVVGSDRDPIVTDVRALLEPQQLSEIRAESRFQRVDAVGAAAGVKIAAPDLDTAIAGAPVRVVRDRPVDQIISEVKTELAAIEVETEEEGVVAKADTLGSLEALGNALDDEDISIMRAEVGDIAPRDVSVASAIEDEKYRAILGFNVDIYDDAQRRAEENDVEIFTNDVIYQLVEEYDEFVETIESQRREAVFENIIRPARIRILPDHVFRQSNPAVVGIEVLSGTLTRNVDLLKFENGDTEQIGTLNEIQEQGEDVEEARAGDRVSVSIEGPTVGRQIKEDDILWVDLPEKHAKVLEQELIED